jgi:hypothetical protein
VNNNTDFLRAMSSGTIYAATTPVHRGRSQQLWLTTITDEKDRVVARGQVRLQNMPPEWSPRLLASWRPSRLRRPRRSPRAARSWFARRPAVR